MPDSEASDRDDHHTVFSAAETRKLLRAITDSLPAVISAKDHNSRYLMMNKYQAALYNTTPEGAIGKTAGELLGKGYGSYTASIDRQVIETGLPVPSYEERYTDAFGVERDWLTTKVPLRRDDQTVYGVASVSLDISELKRTQEELMHKSVALERAHAELLAFTQAAAHDLREPIRQIVSHLELVERQMDGALPDGVRESLDFVLEGAARLHGNFEGFLTYAYLNSTSTARNPVSLEDVLNQASQALRAAVREVGGSIVRQPMPEVVADRTQLIALFDHLLSNAIKFRHPDRPLVIEVFAQNHGRFQEIVVRDNGIGIPEVYRKRIFSMFERLHPREDYPGHGMGLAICKKIVDLQGGEIWCESVENCGTDFLFTLPS